MSLTRAGPAGRRPTPGHRHSRLDHPPMDKHTEAFMYTDINFKTKKALKDALARGMKITYHQPGPFGGKEVKDGKIYLEGPHYPAAHSWYAEATVKDGYIVKVK